MKTRVKEYLEAVIKHCKSGIYNLSEIAEQLEWLLKHIEVVENDGNKQQKEIRQTNKNSRQK